MKRKAKGSRRAPPRRAGPDPPPADMRTGVRCRRCGCAHVPVLYTHPMPYDRIKRIRECRHCGKRMVTYEEAKNSQEALPTGPG